MTPIPQISKAARNALMKWGLANMPENLYAVFCKELAWFALSPSDDLDAVRARKDEPTPMLIWCPECGRRHIDLGEFATKPHHTHACQYCGCCWRPAIVPTVGVQFLPGFKNEEQLPSSPHSALIAELRARIPINRSVDCNTDADLMQRAADALEKLP